jgi:hypothetical protein
MSKQAEPACCGLVPSPKPLPLAPPHTPDPPPCRPPGLPAAAAASRPRGGTRCSASRRAGRRRATQSCRGPRSGGRGEDRGGARRGGAGRPPVRPPRVPPTLTCAPTRPPISPSRPSRPTHQRQPHTEVLGEADKSIVHRRVAVGVVLAQHLAHHTGALLEGPAGGEAEVVHCVEDAAVDGLEAVADVGQRAADDDRHGVLWCGGWEGGEVGLGVGVGGDGVGRRGQRAADDDRHGVLGGRGRVGVLSKPSQASSAALQAVRPESRPQAPLAAAPAPRRPSPSSHTPRGMPLTPPRAAPSPLSSRAAARPAWPRRRRSRRAWRAPPPTGRAAARAPRAAARGAAWRPRARARAGARPTARCRRWHRRCSHCAPRQPGSGAEGIEAGPRAARVRGRGQAQGAPRAARSSCWRGAKSIRPPAGRPPSPGSPHPSPKPPACAPRTWRRSSRAPSAAAPPPGIVVAAAAAADAPLALLAAAAARPPPSAPPAGAPAPLESMDGAADSAFRSALPACLRMPGRGVADWTAVAGRAFRVWLQATLPHHWFCI